MSVAADHIAELRQRGAKAFAAHGLPHKRLEQWKYTPLQALAPAIDSPRSVAPALEGDLKGPGLSVMPIRDALATEDPELTALLQALDAQAPADAMAALNNAELQQGLLIRVDAGVDAGRLTLRWPLAAGAGLAHSRVCILLGKDAALDVFERFDGATQGALNLVTQVDLAPGARLEYARLQADCPATALVTRLETRQAAGSRWRFTGLDVDGALVRHDLRAQLQGAGADCALLGVYLPSGASHLDNHLEIEHQAPGCTSRQFYRGVARDQGKAVFNGRVHVHPGADGTEARQSNANLLLSEHAEVFTKPELEIEADEVVASHGATVGQLDEDAVFYLRSRGLDEAAARQLLTSAFCQAVLDELDAGPVRDALGEALAQATGDWT